MANARPLRDRSGPGRGTSVAVPPVHEDIAQYDEVRRREPKLVLRPEEGIGHSNETRVHGGTPPLGDGVYGQQVAVRRLFNHAAAVNQSKDEMKRYIYLGVTGDAFSFIPAVAIHCLTLEVPPEFQPQPLDAQPE